MSAKHLLCRSFTLGAVSLALFATAQISEAQTNTLTVSPTLETTAMGKGTITSIPAGINCTVYDVGVGAPAKTGTCSAQFSSLGNVTLLATPSDPGVAFNSWGGACSGSGGCLVNMSQAQSVTVRFIPTTTYTLTVQMVGNGTATVRGYFDRGSPAISCFITAGVISGTCTTAYPATARAALEISTSPNAANLLTGFGFSGLCTGTELCYITMAGSKAVTMTARAPTIEIQRAGGTGSGTITGAGGISCSISPTGVSGACLVTYPSASLQTATLAATPGPNSVFAGYTGACTGSTCTAVAGASTVVGATFNLLAFPLTVTGTGAGSGTITSSPGGMNCTINAGSTSGTCAPSFDAGANVTLTPTAGARSAFAGWSNGCTGLGACVVSMTAARSVTARFDLVPPRLDVAGTGSGTVTSQPGGIDCSINPTGNTGSCSAPFSGGTVTLAAAPSAGWRFAGWSGACTGASSCQVAMSQDRNVTATFTPLPVTLTVVGSGTGGGSVSSQPVGITCTISGNGASGQCDAPFDVGTNVTLTASAGAQSTFDGWSAPCGTTTTCQVSMTQARTITARFSGTFVSLTLAATGTGDGTVTSSQGGMNCTVTAGKLDSQNCSAGVAPGSSVTLTARSRNGSTFGGWTGGGCSGTQRTCIVQVPQTGSEVTARFTAPQPIAQLTTVLLGGATLTPDEIAALDEAGNANQRFDLGDLLAQVDRTPGASISPATLSAIAARERQQQGASPKPRRVP